MEKPSRRFIERTKDRWARMTPLEKVGAAALGAAAVAGIVVASAPGFTAATAGGALATGGAYLLRKGFRG